MYFLQGSFLPYLLVGLLDMFQKTGAAAALHLIASLLDPPYAMYGGLHYIERVSALSHGGTSKTRRIEDIFYSSTT